MLVDAKQNLSAFPLRQSFRENIRDLHSLLESVQFTRVYEDTSFVFLSLVKEQVGVSAQHVQGHVVTIRECVRDLDISQGCLRLGSRGCRDVEPVRRSLGRRFTEKSQLVGIVATRGHQGGYRSVRIGCGGTHQVTARPRGNQAQVRSTLVRHLLQWPQSQWWLLAHVEATSCLEVKVASVLDQASDREVGRLPLEVLRKLRARFRAVEGEDP